jgi:hypothetical protein
MLPSVGIAGDCTPAARGRNSEFRASHIDPATGRWITSHVMNQDFV